MATADKRLAYMRNDGCLNRVLNKDEAVTWLMAWRNENVPVYNLDFSEKMKYCITSGLEFIYLNQLVDILIDRIRQSPFDPITEVANYYYEMDDVLAMSDDGHYITHRYASYMENAAHDILNYLTRKEKEMNEYERERMVSKAAR